MGPSDGQVDPNDALSGSNERLELVAGDVIIIKERCPYDLAFILGISLSVVNVDELNIFFLGTLGNVIMGKQVRITLFKCICSH